MLTKFKTFFYFQTVVPIIVYIIVAHLLVNLVPGAVPSKSISIIGYACIVVIVFLILRLSGFVLKRNKILNEAEETNNKKLFMRYFLITQSSVSGIPVIGLVIFFLTGKIFLLYLISILSIPLIFFLYKSNIALVKKHLNE